MKIYFLFLLWPFSYYYFKLKINKIGLYCFQNKILRYSLLFQHLFMANCSIEFRLVYVCVRLRCSCYEIKHHSEQSEISAPVFIRRMQPEVRSTVLFFCSTIGYFLRNSELVFSPHVGRSVITKSAFPSSTIFRYVIACISSEGLRI